MPDVQPSPLAIVFGDIHLCPKAPPARQKEPDWLVALARPLHEIGNLAQELKLPVLCTGDVWDHWRQTPEMINWAIKNMPKVVSVAGNHELPGHNYKEIHKSAYWTLVEAGTIVNLAPEQVLEIFVNDYTHVLSIHGFPWGFPPAPIEPSGEDITSIALVHDFLWIKDHAYTGAPNENRVGAYKAKLQGFDAAFFGDNHKGFLLKAKDPCPIMNVGGAMRRRSDEVDYVPAYGLLMSDGTMQRKAFKCNREEIFVKVSTDKPSPRATPGIDKFMEALLTVSEGSLDYEEAVLAKCYDGTLEQPVIDVLLEAIGRK